MKYIEEVEDEATGEVAPFAGAWIEIDIRKNGEKNSMSLPSRERGLKWHNCPVFPARHHVAPFAGAWIEIYKRGESLYLESSLPSRERGLKYYEVKDFPKSEASLPSRERGLKCQMLFNTSLSINSRSLRGSVD